MANEKLDPTKHMWFAKDGSVFVEKVMHHKHDLGKNTYEVHQPVAFNVGDKVANHLVHLHNTVLRLNAALEK